MTTPNHNRPGYEESDAPAAPIWIAAVALVISIAAVIAGITLFFHWLHHRDLAAQGRTDIDRVTQAVAASDIKFPAPRLQVAPQVDLAALRAREDAELNTYGWIDRKAGVVRLPIDKAMDLIAQRGLPVRGDPNVPKPTRTPLDMQQARPIQREPQKETP